MNYARIIKGDLINGPGVGVTLFVSGCTFKCPGCYNEAAWDFNHGNRFTIETLEEIIEALDHDYIDHFSILGGEALHYNNYREVLEIVKVIKNRFPEKVIWLWTGFKFTRMVQNIVGKYLDVVIDGRYRQELPTTKLYRGSDNQKMWVKEDNRWVIK